MTVRFQGSDTPFYDNTNGLPIGLGTAYFGEPNQDAKANPKVPYTNASYSTATTATQQLNTAGKIPVEIHLNGAYSLAVYDSDGVLQISIPNMEECPGGVTCTSTHLTDTFWDGYVVVSGTPNINLLDYGASSGDTPAGWEPDAPVEIIDTMYLQAKGSWATGYRPTTLKMRISGRNNSSWGLIDPDVGASVDVVVYDTNLDAIGSATVALADEWDSKRFEIQLSFGSYDIYRIQLDADVYIQGPVINCVEFVA